MRAIW